MGVLGGGLLLSLILVLVVAVSLARGEDRLRAAARNVRERAPLRWLTAWPARRRVSESAARRLRVEEAALLTLLAGFGIVLAAAFFFAFLLEDVLDGGGVARLDRPVSRWVAGHRLPWLTDGMRAITHLGGAGAWVVAATVGVIVAVLRRRWVPLAAAMAAAGGIGLVVETIKNVVGRQRPGLPYAITTADGYSFPSGHAAGFTCVAVVSAWLVTRFVVRSWRGGVAVWTAAVVLAAGVGLSRVYLGVHYLSDVLAGWTVGALWAVSIATAVHWWDARESHPPAAIAST